MPKITLKSLKEERGRNRKSNQEFIDFYVEYMKTHGNRVWSRAQRKLIDAVYTKAPRKVAKT
jgi:hypothetical protein